jgi:cellobiose phosphorylase
MNPGLKENGGIFVHTQGWIIMAETMLGHGNSAYEYLRSYLPAAYNSKAEIREIEPYVVCQSTHAKYSPKHGASRVPWLSGSATWTYYAITNYLLGVRAEYDGITIDPCIPSNWERFSVKRIFRGKQLNIEFKNPEKIEKGVKRIILNGKEISGSFINIKEMESVNSIEVLLG